MRTVFPLFLPGQNCVLAQVPAFFDRLFFYLQMAIRRIMAMCQKAAKSRFVFLSVDFFFLAWKALDRRFNVNLNYINAKF